MTSSQLQVQVKEVLNKSFKSNKPNHEEITNIIDTDTMFHDCFAGSQLKQNHDLFLTGSLAPEVLCKTFGPQKFTVAMGYVFLMFGTSMLLSGPFAGGYTIFCCLET